MNMLVPVDARPRPMSWTEWRNRLLASARFQRWAAAFPLTRPIARRHARALFDLGAGFVYAQVAYALVESGLLESLGRRPLTLEEAARGAALLPKAALRLLRAAETLDLAEQRRDGTWILGSRGAMLAGSPGVTAMIAHHRLLYQDLADPLALLRGERQGSLAGLWAYREGESPEAVAAYSRLMAVSQPMVAAQALAAYRFTRHRRLLDVGGGEGAFLTAVAEAAPRLELGLLDLPAVAARAEAALGGRVVAHPGDFLHDPIPGGYDLISLVRILHDHDDEPALALLRRIRSALPAGGRLAVVEPMAGTPGAAPSGHAYFGFYLLAMGSGRPRTPAEIGAMVQEAGFRSWRMRRTPLPLVARVLVAVA